MRKFGAMLLDAASVTLAGGECVDDATGKSVKFTEIAAAAYHAKKLPPNTEPGSVATHFWEPPDFTFPFGSHIVVSEVDRETGAIEIRRYNHARRLARTFRIQCSGHSTPRLPLVPINAP